MTKTLAITTPTNFKFPELKLPKFDLDVLFSSQKANLTAAHETQSVLLGAAEAVAKVQYGYVQESAAEAKAAFASKELPKAEAVKATAEKFVAVAKEVVDLTVAAQKRVYELLTARSQASATELKAVAVTA